MARSTSRGVGNTPADEAYLEWMRLPENGGLEIIDLKEQAEDIPFPAKHKWDGDSDDDDSPWKIPPPGRRCRGKAYVRDADGDYVLDRNNIRLTRPCWRHPMKGMTVCLVHGGGVVRVRRSAIERMASSLDAITGALVKIALNEQVSDKDRISAINSIMDRVGVRGGVEVDLKDPGYLKVLAGLFDSAAEDDEEEENEQPDPRGQEESTEAPRRSRRRVAKSE